MAKVKTKKGVLTPADLATYGIPPKQQPSEDSNLEPRGEAEQNGCRGQQWISGAEKAVGE
jgi:hypothetical protein